jgi:hypothetical protein
VTYLLYILSSSSITPAPQLSMLWHVIHGTVTRRNKWLQQRENATDTLNRHLFKLHRHRDHFNWVNNCNLDLYTFRAELSLRTRKFTICTLRSSIIKVVESTRIWRRGGQISRMGVESWDTHTKRLIENPRCKYQDVKKILAKGWDEVQWRIFVNTRDFWFHKKREDFWISKPASTCQKGRWTMELDNVRGFVRDKSEVSFITRTVRQV